MLFLSLFTIFCTDIPIPKQNDFSTRLTKLSSTLAPSAQNVLIIGAHPNEADRFSFTIPIFWNNSYDKNHSCQFVEFDAEEAERHILCDFNDREKVGQVANMLKSRFSLICFDFGTTGYTEWDQTVLSQILTLLQPGGTLLFPLELVRISFSSCAWKIHSPEDEKPNEPFADFLRRNAVENPTIFLGDFEEGYQFKFPYHCKSEEHRSETTCKEAGCYEKSAPEEGLKTEKKNGLRSFLPTYIDQLQKLVGPGFQVTNRDTAPFSASTEQSELSTYPWIEIKSLADMRSANQDQFA